MTNPTAELLQQEIEKLQNVRSAGQRALRTELVRLAKVRADLDIRMQQRKQHRDAAAAREASRSLAEAEKSLQEAKAQLTDDPRPQYQQLREIQQTSIKLAEGTLALARSAETATRSQNAAVSAVDANLLQWFDVLCQRAARASSDPAVAEGVLLILSAGTIVVGFGYPGVAAIGAAVLWAKDAVEKLSTPGRVRRLDEALLQAEQVEQATVVIRTVAGLGEKWLLIL